MSLVASAKLIYAEPISTELGDRVYTVLVGNQVTQVNSAWPSLHG